MIATLPLNLLIVRFLVLGDRDDGFAIERLHIVVRPCAYFQARPAFAVFLEQFCDLAATMQRRMERRDRREPDVPAPQMPLRRPARQHLRQIRSEEHTSELQSLMRISYAVFCLKKKN